MPLSDDRCESRGTCRRPGVAAAKALGAHVHASSSFCVDDASIYLIVVDPAFDLDVIRDYLKRARYGFRPSVVEISSSLSIAFFHRTCRHDDFLAAERFACPSSVDVLLAFVPSGRLRRDRCRIPSGGSDPSIEGRNTVLRSFPKKNGSVCYFVPTEYFFSLFLLERKRKRWKKRNRRKKK